MGSGGFCTPPGARPQGPTPAAGNTRSAHERHPDPQPGGQPHPDRGALRGGAGPDRGAGGAAVGRGPVHPVDAGCQPAKWHRAHTTWFFETFLLSPHLPGYRRFDRASASCSTPTTRRSARGMPGPQRGMLTRPSLAEVGAYRAHVDAGDGRAAARRRRRKPLAAGRAGPATRAAAPGTAADRHPARAVRRIPCCRPMTRPGGSRARRPARRAGWTDARAAWWRSAMPVLASPSTTRRRATRLARPLPHRRPAGDQWRMARLHRRWRLSHAHALDVRWLGRRAGRGLGGAAVLAARRGGWLQYHPGRAAARSIPAAPVRHVCWYEAEAFARWAGSAAADRGRVGGRRHAARRPRRDRPSAGNGPPAPTLPIPASALGGRGRRVQRQVHDQPDGPARRLAGHPARPYPPELPQFFPPGARWQFSTLRLAEDAA